MSGSEDVHGSSPCSDDDLEGVEASESDLMDDEMISLRFGRSTKMKDILNSYISRWTLAEDLVHTPGKEEMSIPHAELLMKLLYLGIILLLVFVFPCDNLREEILKAYGIELHHLTSNGISKIALFIWAVKTQDITPNIGALCSRYEMHTQFKSVVVNGPRPIHPHPRPASPHPSRHPGADTGGPSGAAGLQSPVKPSSKFPSTLAPAPLAKRP